MTPFGRGAADRLSNRGAPLLGTSSIVRTFIVEDHELIRASLRFLLEKDGHFVVVGEATTAREALRGIEQLAPDIALIDLTLPGASGLTVIRELRRMRSRCRRLVLTMHESVDFVLDALAAGAHGYALKDDSPAMLFAAIRIVSDGQRYLSARLSPAVIAAIDETDLVKRRRAAHHALSPRETEVFDLLIRGYDNRQIASELNVSIKTVESHRTHIFGKFKVHSLAALVRAAARRGLLPLGGDGER